MSETGKKKEINLGVTDGLKEFLNEWTERTFSLAESLKEEEAKDEGKKIVTELKGAIINVVKKEVVKIDEKLSKCKDDDEWFKLIEKINKLSDVVRWY